MNLIIQTRILTAMATNIIPMHQVAIIERPATLAIIAKLLPDISIFPMKGELGPQFSKNRDLDKGEIR